MKGFAIVVACAIAIVIALWALSQLFTLSADGVEDDGRPGEPSSVGALAGSGADLSRLA